MLRETTMFEWCMVEYRNNSQTFVKSGIQRILFIKFYAFPSLLQGELWPTVLPL